MGLMKETKMSASSLLKFIRHCSLILSNVVKVALGLLEGRCLPAENPPVEPVPSLEVLI